MQIATRKSQQAGERGAAFVEFVVCFSLVWLPIFTGLLFVGFNLVQAIRVSQVCREAGHLYAFGTDFSQPAGQALLAGTAVGLDLSGTGNAKLIFTTVTYIDTNDCQGGNLQPDSTHCPNLHQYVIMKRVVVPSSSGVAMTSNYGAPAASIMDSSGNVSTANQLTQTSARVPVGFFGASNGITLVSGQWSYVSEFYAKPMLGSGSGPRAQAFF